MTSWRTVLVTLALLSVAFAVVSWVIEGVTPSWIVFPILLIIGLVRARKGRSAGTVWLGLSALVFLLVHLPFDKAALPENCVDPADADRACHPAWWLLSLGAVPLLMVVSAAMAFRETGGVWRLPWVRK